MRLVLQRVTSAAVEWEPEQPASEPTQEAAPTAKPASERREIGRGLAILLGVAGEDDEATAVRLAEKVSLLRIFADELGRTNLSLKDVAGEALVVSQFTLYADISRGRRPSFIRSGDPDTAKRLYKLFASALADQGITVRTGSFGADMRVSIENDGPFTLVLSSDDWSTKA